MIKKSAENHNSLSVVIIFKSYSFNINFSSYFWLVSDAARVHEGRVTSLVHHLCSLTRLHIQKGPESGLKLSHHHLNMNRRYNRYQITCLAPEELKTMNKP